MGKIVMPKNSALLNEIEAVLKIYYEANDWMSNDIYKEKLKALIGDDQYQSSYTKKAQITSYFGFTVWEDINNPQSLRRITASGKKMYEAIKANDVSLIQDILMDSLENVTFGRNNYGCPQSDSDVEPPALFIRASLDMGYLTYREFAYLLWKLEDVGKNYTDALNDLRQFRTSGTVELGEEATKYTDCKPIMILVRWGFLSELDDDSTGGKHIVVNPTVKTKFEQRLRGLKVYNIDMDVSPEIFDDDKIDESKRLTGGTNVILYGVPGAGKSWTIDHEYMDEETIMKKVVFHPDYTYSDFVGQILPKKVNDSISYDFVPGPFTKIMKEAYENPARKFILAIEEINRGNAPAIFGDIFQLLDRDENGRSSYEIINADIARIVYGDENHVVYIPSNLSILCTMNTSDQNVFTLDTAFQRRWNMRLIENSFRKDSDEEKKFAEHPILDSDIKWESFCSAINAQILEKNQNMTSSEDKRLGTHFVNLDDLNYYDEESATSDTEKLKIRLKNRRFPEKVIKYLWDDAFKFYRDEIFKAELNSLEKVIKVFTEKKKNDRFEIFKDNIRAAIFDENSKQ